MKIPSSFVPTDYCSRSRKHWIGVLLLGCFVALQLCVVQRNKSRDDVEGITTFHIRTNTYTSDTVQGTTSRFLQQQDNNCTESCCEQFVVEPASSNPFAALPDAIQIIMMGLLITFSAIFSGLTLGLMGLDKTGLEIVMEGDDLINAAYAKKIYPLRKRGNLLLCTLLLGNTSVNALLSILLADWAGGILGFIVSTLLILILGEITPQAVCSRYALAIGSRAIPLVRVIVILLLPISFPLAWILDQALGAELATTYSNQEMLKLLQIHVAENAMDPETANTMTGALQYKQMAVRDVMTPLSNTYMLKSDERLNFETIAKIFKTGYSRIPVYEINQNNVIGLLFVKDLIFIDPEDETRVSDLVDIFRRGVHVVWLDDKLGDVLRELKQGRSHMAVVRDVNNQNEKQDPYYEVKGIITLEDIIEEILGDEILDETDAFRDGTHAVTIDREDAFKFARLRLLDRKIVDERLSYDETRAVSAHLWKNYPQVVSLLTENQLHQLVTDTTVSVLPTAEQEIGQGMPSDLMYEKGIPSDVCTLIIAGKVTVLVGSDQFRSDVSSFALLGTGALIDDSPSYVPDFTAFVSSGPCRCIRISRARYTEAVDASAVERTGRQNTKQVGIPPSNEGTAMVPSEDPLTDIGEMASRKVKMMTAFIAVDANTTTKPSSESSRILFSESDHLLSYDQQKHSKLANSDTHSLVVPITQSTEKQFEYIGSKSSSARNVDAPDDENTD